MTLGTPSVAASNEETPAPQPEEGLWIPPHTLAKLAVYLGDLDVRDPEQLLEGVRRIVDREHHEAEPTAFEREQSRSGRRRSGRLRRRSLYKRVRTKRFRRVLYTMLALLLLSITAVALLISLGNQPRADL